MSKRNAKTEEKNLHTSNRPRMTIPWIGGKYYSAERIRQALPPPRDYDVYVEPFGGGASVMAGLSPGSHTEVYNDSNKDLVNWWMQMRDESEYMQERLDSLPYSRSLYQQYHASLFDGSHLEPMERAVRWYYVLRSSFTVNVRPSRSGWSSGRGGERVRTYHNAVSLLPQVAARFRYVQIECRDFSEILKHYEGPRTLFYVDPPYIGYEKYYRGPDNKRFDWHDHEQLAEFLNTTSAMVALSYYIHPQLDTWYPSTTWRRMEWQTIKHAQRTRATHDRVQEVLLMNYASSDDRPNEVSP